MIRFSCKVLGINKKLPPKIIDQIIRVDHAGELCADQIYAGQMAVMGNTEVGPEIQEMWDQEKMHLKTFNKLLADHRARPSALLPIASQFGYWLGYTSALISKETAMTCTVAVETVITDHYNAQLRDLIKILEGKDNKESKVDLDHDEDVTPEIKECINSEDITVEEVHFSYFSY